MQTQTLSYQKAESIIGYRFNNIKLLKQAFFRSSYANENNRESNEVLEFIGDKVLDYAVVRILTEKFGKNKEGEYFKSSKDEGDLTSIKSTLVDSGSLAVALEYAGLEEFICYGKNDEKNGMLNNVSVYEDVFEAIIGAIAIDSNWNMDVVIPIIEKLLKADHNISNWESDNNYVGRVQEEADRLHLGKPEYDIFNKKAGERTVWAAVLTIEGLEHSTTGAGFTQKEARRDAAFQMLPFLEEYDYKHPKKAPGPDTDVFAEYNKLVQQGVVNKSEFEFEETHDSDGNPIWRCAIEVDGTKYCGRGMSKKDAQKGALFSLLVEYSRTHRYGESD